uniref:hypothetical protein n=1 Tax=Amycolatopsis sp. CA-096443 TaxID=3239919 RepID=UPI003F49A7DC
MDWQTAYRELDNPTLLSLASLLQDRIDRAKRELETIAGSASDRAETAEGHRRLDQAVALKAGGHDLPRIIDEFRKALRPRDDFELEDQRIQQGLLGYLVDLEIRRNWIVDVEVVRRGLLPDPADFLSETLRR